MTRYPPQGPPQDGYQSGEAYSYQQPQCGQSEPNYGAYNTGEGQAYTQQQPTYQQPPPQYGGEAPGSAQSYYGANDQPYQQYPNASSGGYSGQQYQSAPPPPPGLHHQQIPPMHSTPPVYGGGQHYPPPEYPPYGQQYAQLAYGGPLQGSGNDDVATFRSHFEQPHGPIDPATAPPEGDRGFMGALAGGAAGAYGGHKVNHGFLGGIGGAVAGSMLEDAYKKKNKKPKSRRGSQSSSSSSGSDDERKHHHTPVVVAGNFHASSRNIHLEDHATLVAECCDTHGHHRSSHLDLNDCFTNSSGRLCWARGGNFAASARNIRLADGGNALEAELGDGRGGWQYNKVWLNVRITNEDGRLLLL